MTARHHQKQARMSQTSEPQTFWDHLEVLRFSLLKILAASVAVGTLAFCMKETLFGVVLAPSRSAFVTYRLLGAEPFSIRLINTGLTEQFIIHIKVAFAAGLLIALPYIVYVLFSFVSPALYDRERRLSVRLCVGAYTMFAIGTLVNYFVIFPLSVRFLGTYQVSADIQNMLTVSSYVDTLLMMTLVFGIVFEIPVVCWLLARAGMLRAEWMSRYRRHAIVAILAVAAVITPTADMFTLVIVALPVLALYEISILIVRAG